MKLTDYLPLDKCYHVIAGILIFAVCHFFIGYWSMLVVLSIAVIKEVYDKHSGKGTPEWQDIMFTVVGGLLGLVCNF